LPQTFQLGERHGQDGQHLRGTEFLAPSLFSELHLPVGQINKGQNVTERALGSKNKK
jgi:hypothetical protein